jgi:hypothetical protein
MALVVEIDEQLLAATFDALPPHLDERQRWRRWRGRWGTVGSTWLRGLLGYPRKTVVAGPSWTWGRAWRRTGEMGEVGRKPLAELAPGLLDALDDLVEPETRGDPMTRLRWATKSTRNLADGLGRQGHQVSYHRGVEHHQLRSSRRTGTFLTHGP